MGRSLTALLSLIFVIGACSSSVMAAPESQQVLLKFFSEVKSLKADFSQAVFDDNQVQLQATRGTMALKRPGRFRWDYAKPYEQHIIGDSKNIYIYDVDLEQVTVKHQEQALGDTPAQLLSTSRPVDASFNISEMGEQNGLLWFELRPKKSEETGFERIRLGFDRQDLKRMELEDGLGHTTQLDFDQIQRNPKVDDSLFHFDPPAGVDVVGP